MPLKIFDTTQNVLISSNASHERLFRSDPLNLFSSPFDRIAKSFSSCKHQNHQSAANILGCL